MGNEYIKDNFFKEDTFFRFELNKKEYFEGEIIEGKINVHPLMDTIFDGNISIKLKAYEE